MQNESKLNMASRNDPSILYPLTANHAVYYGVKRGIDILIALSLLVFFSPLMLLIAAAIRLYSPGPLFFVQERVGAKGQAHGKDLKWKRTTFRCFKFRTMHINADPTVHQAYVKALIDNDQEAMAKIQGKKTNIRKLVQDARITRPGRLLRKLSLDELPQLWNVLRGDMSLVGPRPAIPYEVEMYKAWYLRRLEAKPGITGLQQITARSAEDFDQQVQLDLQYIDHQSLWLDFKIMLKTPFVIISTKGAA
jgi:lipopolysaccharide/colanic/teichoic acid biosynthesis glycosyltransferase